MDWFDLMSSEHFLVILHPDKKHSLIFNRLDDSIATIDYESAKELCNVKRVGRFYGIVGRFLHKHLVLIKNRALIGNLYDPVTKTENKVYVITQVQVVDIACIANFAEPVVGTPELSRNQIVNDDGTIDDAFGNIDKSRGDGVKEPESDPSDFSSLPASISSKGFTSMQSRAAPWNPFRLANSLKPKMPTQFLRSTLGAEAAMYSQETHDKSAHAGGSLHHHSQQSQQQLPHQTPEDSDKRLVEEMVKLFNNTNSFYYSPTLDLTNRFSRKKSIKIPNRRQETLWKTADERFFWNKYMLEDLIKLSETDDNANYFIYVILQGFIAIENHTIYGTSSNILSESSGVERGLPAASANQTLGPFNSVTRGNSTNNHHDSSTSFSNIQHGDSPFSNLSDNSTRSLTRNYQLALISRRSVFHAGTRYRRRGCDELGNCANFVETEQIFRFNQHFTSIVLLRGSIPLFWYQTGFNYRPPPVLFGTEEENFEAFRKHFENLIRIYETDQIFIIDCTEHSGREKVLHDTYKRSTEKLRSSRPHIKLIEFDFHKHCRARQCTDSQVERHLRACGLSEKLIKNVMYHYCNDGDTVLAQEGVFRVNCLDCSDRTNVVQRALALHVFDMQLALLGVIAPDTSPEDNEFRKIMQNIWSTNGNVLSTQYCGTRALFTGDKKLSGYLKDTYSSASRYYIGKFRDAYRQAAIDAMLGVKSRALGPSGCAQPTVLDQYDLLGQDPIVAVRTGSALLRDVGTRVGNRLARFRGHFNARPPVDYHHRGNVEMSQAAEEVFMAEVNQEIMEAQISDTLDGLNIDWPSSESVETEADKRTVLESSRSATLRKAGVLRQISRSDDNLQADEISPVVLSLDAVNSHQHYRSQPSPNVNPQSNKDNDQSEQQLHDEVEEIDLPQSCSAKEGLSKRADANETNTTSA